MLGRKRRCQRWKLASAQWLARWRHTGKATSHEGEHARKILDLDGVGDKGERIGKVSRVCGAVFYCESHVVCMLVY